MSTQETGGYCRQCDRPVMIRRQRANHILHLLLTVLTLGLWAIVWLGTAVRFGGWRCSQCGGPAQQRSATAVDSGKAVSVLVLLFFIVVFILIIAGNFTQP